MATSLLALMADLYETLGIKRDADTDAVKKAYRKKAHETHPDKNKGDPKAGEKFHAVTVAYQVLSDPSRRKQYDETGDASQHDPRQEAMAEIAGLILSIIADCSDVERTDIVGAARDHILDIRKNLERQIEKVRSAIKKREKAQKRIRNKKGQTNAILNMIAADIQSLQHQIEGGLRTLERGKLMLELLDDYEYKTEPSPLVSSGGLPFTFTVRP